MNPKQIQKSLEKIDASVETIKVDVHALKVTQAKQTADWEHHVRRTDELQDIVEPLHTKYHQLIGGLKILTTLTALISLLQFLRSVLHLF